MSNLAIMQIDSYQKEKWGHSKPNVKPQTDSLVIHISNAYHMFPVKMIEAILTWQMTIYAEHKAYDYLFAFTESKYPIHFQC